MTLSIGPLPWAGVVPGVLAKSALLVLAAAVATRVPPLRHASAAARHLVWTLAVCALVLLPPLAAVLPAWEAGWIPAAPRAALPVSGPPPARVDGGAFPADESPPPVGVAAASLPSAPAEDAEAGSAWPGWARLLGGAYALGVLAALGWAAAGFAAVRRMASRAAAVTDPEWTALLRDVAWELEVRRPVALLRSPSQAMPMTWGVRRAAILLPAAADAWPAARRRVVLLHEMAHVARHDCLTQAVAAVACALWWFHPGAWYAARRLRVERELACDDRVLAAGTGPRLYAGHLLEIARAFRAPLVAAPGAVSMARPSQLEGRLLAVLDAVRSRRPVARAAVLAAALGAAAVVLPLAALAPAPSEAAGADGIAPARRAATTGGEAFAEEPPPPDAPPAEALVQTTFGGRLDLQLASPSDVRITGWDRDAVQVRSWARSGTAPGVAVRLVRTAEGARIDGTRATAAGAHHVEIRVPRRYDLQIRGGGSRVEVRDLGGRVAGSTQGGDVVLAQVGGPVALATAGGTADVSDSRLTGRLWTAGGDAAVRGNEGDLDVRAGAGTAVVETRGEDDLPVLRRFRGGVRTVAGTARVTLDQGEGDVFVQDAIESIDARTGRGTIHVGSAAGHARAHTARGDVVLHGARGSVDVRTGAGSAFVQMLESRDATVASDAGGVTLVLPAGFHGRIDVTATAAAGRPQGRIRSDFPLRAVRTGGITRAAGTVGSGGPRITLAATGGDVLIRRAPPLRR